MEKVVGEGVGFERIRRVTGYLAGDVKRFNNGKRAEEYITPIDINKNIVDEIAIEKKLNEFNDLFVIFQNNFQNENKEELAKELYDKKGLTNYNHSLKVIRSKEVQENLELKTILNWKIEKIERKIMNF